MNYHEEVYYQPGGANEEARALVATSLKAPVHTALFHLMENIGIRHHDMIPTIKIYPSSIHHPAPGRSAERYPDDLHRYPR